VEADSVGVILGAIVMLYHDTWPSCYKYNIIFLEVSRPDRNSLHALEGCGNDLRCQDGGTLTKADGDLHKYWLVVSNPIARFYSQ
jgi:hypothetical protein